MSYNMLDAKEIPVFEVLIERGLIPKYGQFEVTRELTKHAYNVYREIYPPASDKLKAKEIEFILKMKALNLTKLNMSRLKEIPVLKRDKLKTKAGFVYVISNPVFPGFIKIGITRDIINRLKSYQTCDPFRRYKIESYYFVENIRLTEKKLLDKFKSNTSNGEWLESKYLDEIKNILK